MKELIKKIQAARDFIKKSNLKKAGKNDFSKYSYYTPEQINKLVYDAEKEAGLFHKFDLLRDENGLHGYLVIYDIETAETFQFTQATAIPDIKATVSTQQLGGAVTYTNRYLLMTAYDIVDNNLDFDAHDNRTAPVVKKWLNPDTIEWSKAIKFLSEDGNTMADVKKGYKISVTNEKLLKDETL